MQDTTHVIAFIIVSFCLAVVLLLKRDSIPPRIKRGLALVTLAMIAFSFFLVVYSFMQM
ncbi:hypothetical protein [Paenibacillus senegalensis]|uniref:hypothetical protein n=1 Tax=Paenibacillus senegalensis TaxID=1465766 RepID=UPI0013BEA815